MTGNVLKYWEADRVDCPSTTVPKLVTTLRGGESLTLKSPPETKDLHYIGSNKDMIAARSYQLDKGETLTLMLPIEFGVDNYIEIWALPETAGDDICFVKLIDQFPQTAASD